MEFDGFEGEILARPRPLVGLLKLGDATHLEELSSILKYALDPHHTVVDYAPPREAGSADAEHGRNCSTESVKTRSSSEKSTRTQASTRSRIRTGVGITVHWLQKYLHERPATILVLLTLPAASNPGEPADSLLAEQLQRLSAGFGQTAQKMFTILYAPSGFAAARRDSLLKHAQIGAQSLVIIESASDIANGVQRYGSLVGGRCISIRCLVMVKGHDGHYYHEKIKKYRKAFPAKHDQYVVPLHGALHYHFKIAYMEMLLGDSPAALKALSTAYTAVVEHCRALNRPEEITAALQSIRWVCDAVSYKISAILFEGGSKGDADEYVAGHIAWFSQSHDDQMSLCRWKCKIYSAMGEMLKGHQSLSRHLRHAGYYYYLSAKNAMAMEQMCTARSASFVERTVELLLAAYDFYRKHGYQRLTLQIGRLIASQYLLVDNYAQAFQALSKIKKACRAEAWKLIVGDVLMELISLAAKSQDARAELENYWEYASLFPEAVMDDFEARITGLAQCLNGEPLLLDISAVGGSFVSCSVRFTKEAGTVGQQLPIEVLISNMSPMVFSVSSVTVRLTNGTASDLHFAPATDIVPGASLCRLSILLPKQHGPHTVESVTVSFSDLAIRLFFPASALSLNESYGDASWGDITVNWSYLQRLELFSEASLSATVAPIAPEIEYTCDQPLPLLLGVPCPLSLSVANMRAYAVRCTLRFSGTIQGVLVSTDSQAVPKPLMNFTHEQNLPASGAETLTLYITQNQEQQIALRIDCYYRFVEAELEAHPNFLSGESCATSQDILMALTMPFHTHSDMVSFPSERAQSAAAEDAGQRDLVKYLAYITVSCSLPRAEIHTWSLYLKGKKETRFRCVAPRENDPILLQKDQSYRFLFQIEAEAIRGEEAGEGAGAGAGEEAGEEGARERGKEDTDFVWHPVFSLGWRGDAEMAESGYECELDAVSVYSRAVFVVPSPAYDQRVGRPAGCEWLVWNMTESLQDIVLRVEVGEDYVYMGPKQERRQIAPRCSFSLSGTIVPLKPGPAKAPTLVVRAAQPGNSVFFETLARPAVYVQI